MSKELDTRVKWMKLIYAVFGPCALAIGLWMVISPSNFWGLLQVDYDDPISQTLYGAVLCGVGVICLLGVAKPLQYIAVFQFMMAYKTILVIALIVRLATIDDAPIAGWLIAFFWGCIAIVSALVYPWGKRDEVVEALKDE